MSPLRLIRRVLGRSTCRHEDAIRSVTPSSPDGCTRCLELGHTWFHLRICLICGQVGCCDNSKNRHATRHFRETGHPVIQSFQPGEAWRYCYPDRMTLPDGTAFRARVRE